METLCDPDFTSYIGTYQGCREVTVVLHKKARRRGLDRAKRVVFIGSGVVEAGCKTVVGRRLKQSGMFGSQVGAENILSLRCPVLGPQFENAWKALRTLNTSCS